jgi:hypothetical protein
VDLNQLFDVSADPKVKELLLSGNYNVIQCRNCGFTGNMSSPLVYHDPEKELLLTFFPPELGMPANEQERLMGPMITQVMNRLPMEKRKAYLLRPQTMLTMQGMIERILEADGITREMLQSQQDRLNLLQRFLTASSDDVLAEIAKQEEKKMDEQFFGLMNQIIEATLSGGDEKNARLMADLQKKLLPLSPVGQKLQHQAQETEAALRSLQEAGQKGLTRQALLDLVVNAPNETRLAALVSFARSGMDYTFFEILSDRVERAVGPDKTRLTELRDKLVTMTQEIDEALKKQVDVARQLLEKLVAAPDIAKATAEALHELNQAFMEVLKTELEEARQKNDTARLEKLQQVVGILQQASQPPAEIAIIEDLLQAEDEATMRKVLEEHKAEINEEFLGYFSNLVTQAQDQDPQVVEKLKQAYRVALRYNMTANLQK